MLNVLFLLLWLATLDEQASDSYGLWRLRLTIFAIVAVPVVVLLGLGAALLWLVWWWLS